VDERLMGAFVSFEPHDTFDEAMDFCECFALPKHVS
jgi:hypothetical protein